MSTPYDQDKDDPLAPAKGISLGVCLGALTWGLIIAALLCGFLTAIAAYIMWLMP